MIDDTFNAYIHNIIRSNILINLNKQEFEFIMKLLVELINFIACRFNFDDNDNTKYVYQFKQNNNRDLYAIFNMLLPFIDDKGGSFQLHKQIYNLKDITIKKHPDKVNGWTNPSNNGSNENMVENPYIISNLQFNRNNVNRVFLDKFAGAATAATTATGITNIDTNLEYFHEYELTIADLLSNFYILLNTIDQISHKLYVNWINIRPITWDYKLSRLYKNTYKYNSATHLLEVMVNNTNIIFRWFNPILIRFFDNDVNYEKIYPAIYASKNYKGLYVGDFYNMTHHELFFSIKNMKWLIYELPVNNAGEQIQMYWTYISNNFDKLSDYILDGTDFDQILVQNNMLVMDWKNTMSRMSKNTNHLILYDIIYFFQRKYSKVDTLINFVPLANIKDIDLENQDRDILDDDIYDNSGEKIHTHTKEEIIKSWESIEIEHFYNYLMETIDMFKKTWYGRQIIIEKKKHPSLVNSEIHVANITHPVTFKNIYNWAKCMLIFTYTGEVTTSKRKKISVENLYYHKDNTWHNMGAVNYVEMEIANHTSNVNNAIKKPDVIDLIDKVLMRQKINYINALTTTKEKTFFNIKRILKTKIYKKIGLTDTQITELNNEINEVIRVNITDIVFECLLVRGTLNEFVVDKECTDVEISKQRRSDAVKKNIFNKNNISKYSKCTYYLTSEPYENLQNNYFERLPNDQWYTFYAMDWVSQINFYHRYINNRVLYITGATGAGKSTQVPKLLLYGLKMINFNNSGKVVSTQPRTKPTIDNAENIANEMGVPIVTYSKEIDANIKTNLGYIQYKTAKKIHQQDNKFDYFFMEMTDGTLVNELYRNALLKQIKVADKDDTYSRKLQYKLDNLYDIVIVDESHEHNKNMDYILTLMRYAIYWNNSLKLIIVSATMDDDEPIYRRYYNKINDNQLYPLNYYNAMIGFYYNKFYYTLDRITVDRRIHISAPGETTQHKINDIYLDRNPIDYAEAEKIGIETVLRLIQSGVNGDMLFFSLGEAQIRNIVTYLNDNTPPNVIALPFFSELSDKWSEYAVKTYKIKEIDIDKRELFKEISATGTAKRIGSNTYTQAIVVATNIAEASITILDLKYVIDTGYYNSVTYDSITRSTVATVAPITESSRLQRRGRVGRISSGSVYYMYVKDSHKYIEPSYNICVSNIRNDVYKMMRDKHDEHKLIDIRYNVNMYLISENPLYEHITSNNVLGESYEYLFKYLISFQPTKYTYDKITNPNDYDNTLWKSIDDIFQFQYVYHRLDAIDMTLRNVVDIGDFNYNMMYGYVGCNLFMDYYDKQFTYLYGIHDRYITGYDMTSMIDLCGTFYIIHPADNMVRRHLLTGLIDFNKITDKPIEKYFIKSLGYTSTLQISKMIIPSDVKSDNIISIKNSIAHISKQKFINMLVINQIMYLSAIPLSLINTTSQKSDIIPYLDDLIYKIYQMIILTRHNFRERFFIYMTN